VAAFSKMTADQLSDAIDTLIAASFTFDQQATIAGRNGLCAHSVWAEDHRERLRDELRCVVVEYLTRSLARSDADQRQFALSRAWSFIVRPPYSAPAVVLGVVAS